MPCAPCSTKKDNSDADEPPVRLCACFCRSRIAVETDRLDRAPQAFGMIAAVEVLADDIVERHLLRPHHIAQPHLVRLESGLPRDRIHDRFDREADAGPRDTAIGNDRAFVGRDRVGAAAIVRKDVRARQQIGDLRRLEAPRKSDTRNRPRHRRGQRNRCRGACRRRSA